MKSIYVFGKSSKNNPVDSKTKKDMTVTYALGKAFSRKDGKDLYPNVSQPRDAKGAFTPFKAIQSFLQNYAKLEVLYDGQVYNGGEQAYKRMLNFIMEPSGDAEKKNVKKEDGSIKLEWVHVGLKDKSQHRGYNDRRISISGLAASWKWTRTRVRKFIEPVLDECICNYIRDRLKRQANNLDDTGHRPGYDTGKAIDIIGKGTVGSTTLSTTLSTTPEEYEETQYLDLNEELSEAPTVQDKSLISLPNPLLDRPLLLKNIKTEEKATAKADVEWYPEDSPSVTHLSASLQDDDPYANGDFGDEPCDDFYCHNAEFLELTESFGQASRVSLREALKDDMIYKPNTVCHRDGYCRSCHELDECYMWDEWYEVHGGIKSTFRKMIIEHRKVNPFAMEE